MTRVPRSRPVLALWADGRSLPFPLRRLQPSAARLLSAPLPVYAAVRFRAGSETAPVSQDAAGWLSLRSSRGRKAGGIVVALITHAFLLL